MDKRLAVLCGIAAVGMIFSSIPDGALSVIMVLFIAIPGIIIVRKNSDSDNEKKLLTDIFIIALLARITLGLIIHVFDLRSLFGPDATLYDLAGGIQAEYWMGANLPNDPIIMRVLNPGASGWGMFYLVGVIYLVFGKSILVAQSFCGAIGALTAPLVYFCAKRIFNNRKVGKISAIAIALFPSFIIWSSQLLKDGLLIFLLVAVMLVLLDLQKKLTIRSVAILLVALIAIFALRFYLFYMVAVAVAGSFFIGAGATLTTVIRNLIIVIILGMGLTYLGILRGASENLETYGNLERVQNSRDDLAKSANSGFGEETDVSTPTGAILAIPVGLAYLYFAPFPWQINKVNQALVVPETIVWWCLIPVMIIGLKYTLKNKFRVTLPILLFSVMLTLLYSIFQGNVGMLYRQRVQIQVFLFMFIAAGIVIIQERRENTRMMHQIRNNATNRKNK